ncbi:hypothetical protein CDAR_487661 [Caerostris darwini]|uniref:Uncharacterized protein n=1 Tax=Caerostris darwini TaxID=1538125 RepID=A0AAV4PSH6_9ARAC|nr:hypothetical protein CDAR_487661 [Caerostris darwini]
MLWKPMHIFLKLRKDTLKRYQYPRPHRQQPLAKVCMSLMSVNGRNVLSLASLARNVNTTDDEKGVFFGGEGNIPNDGSCEKHQLLPLQLPPPFAEQTFNFPWPPLFIPPPVPHSRLLFSSFNQQPSLPKACFWSTLRMRMPDGPCLVV